MSLLNDALKRASQSQQGHDTVRLHLPPAEPIKAMAPAAPAESNPKSGLGWFPILVILMAAIAGAFIFLAHFSAKHRAHIATIIPVSQPVQPIPPAPKPALPPATKRAVAVTTPVARPISLPRLKLQGITYYNGKWQAIVNGTTVYVGDRVKGFRVAMISRNHVLFIAPDGSKEKLALGE